MRRTPYMRLRLDLGTPFSRKRGTFAARGVFHVIGSSIALQITVVERNMPRSTIQKTWTVGDREPLPTLRCLDLEGMRWLTSRFAPRVVSSAGVVPSVLPARAGHSHEPQPNDIGDSSELNHAQNSWEKNWASLVRRAVAKVKEQAKQDSWTGVANAIICNWCGRRGH